MNNHSTQIYWIPNEYSLNTYWVCLLTKVGTVVHDSSCLPVMWPRFKSWHRRHLWVGFVVGSLPSSERLYYASFGFPVSSRLNSSSIRNACTCLDKFLRTPQCGLMDKQITKILFLAIYNLEHYSEHFRIWKSINCLHSF